MVNKGYVNVLNELTRIDARRNSPTYYLYGDLDSQQEYYEMLLSVTPEFMYVPCRKCPACLKKRSNELSGRLTRECEFWINHGCKIMFCTFTYSPEFIDSAPTTYKNDLAVLFDSLRSRYRRSIRHWCIPELGEKKGRFHIHALLFDVPDDLGPDAHFHYSKNGALHGSNKVFDKLWSKGVNDVGFLREIKGAIYMAGYLTKSDEKNLKHNNGLPFKGGIVCSNKIGFLDVDKNDIIDQVNKGLTPIYKIGPFTFCYPQSLVRKYTLPLQQRYVSFMNSLKRYVLGGEWIFHKNHYLTYTDYSSAVQNAVGGSAYKKCIEVVKVYNPSYGLNSNTNFDIEEFF